MACCCLGDDLPRARGCAGSLDCSAARKLQLFHSPPLHLLDSLDLLLRSKLPTIPSRHLLPHSPRHTLDYTSNDTKTQATMGVSSLPPDAPPSQKHSPSLRHPSMEMQRRCFCTFARCTDSETVSQQTRRCSRRRCGRRKLRRSTTCRSAAGRAICKFARKLKKPTCPVTRGRSGVWWQVKLAFTASTSKQPTR